jgi:hypothetical protein
MNWIEFIWHLMAGACLTLSGIYLLVWLRRRRQYEHLSLSLAAAAVAAMAVLEPMALQARTVEEFGLVARWFHLPGSLFVIAMVPFVRLRYGVGSLWLGSAVIVTRLAALGANFSFGANLNFSTVDALVPLAWLGTPIMAPQGTTNPWQVLGSLSLLLLVVFLLHGAWQLWRREPGENRWHATAILLSAVMFLAVVGAWTALVSAGWLALPFLIVPPFVSSKNAGLGLGLAVCRTIVHAHDGRLWAENNAGAGATLHLELRAAPANAGA